MKTLRHIELFLDGSYTPHDSKRFIFGSRCICNFIERELAKINFASPYSRINIYFVSDGDEPSFIPLNPSPYLQVNIPLQIVPLSELSSEEIQIQYSKAITLGVNVINSHTPLPKENILNSIEMFRTLGYVNRWEHQSKIWSKYKCRATIEAGLTTDHFFADQLIYIDDSLVAKRRIVESLPREGIFENYLGRLSITKQGIIEYKIQSNSLTAFDIKSQMFIEPTPEKPYS